MRCYQCANSAVSIRLNSTEDDPLTTGGNQLLLDLYRTMRRIRTFEERVNELFVRGQTAGSMLHMSIGEEAISGKRSRQGNCKGHDDRRSGCG